MSEEFSCEVKLKCNDLKSIELLQSVSSFFDSQSYGDAESFIKQIDYKAPIETIKSLMADSYHTKNLGETLVYCAEQSTAELGVKSKFGMSYLSVLEAKSEGKYEFIGSGVDREAHQFCKYLAIFLYALSESDLVVNGSGSFWGGSWSISNGVLSEKLKVHES